MAAASRTSQFQTLHKVLKKHYKPVAPDGNRSVLEQLLFACCLENAPYGRAEEGLAGLMHNFFDWNEVRVSTVRELSEVLAGVPDPVTAANRVKRVLQHVFEATYSFDLEELRKKSLTQATEELQKIEGTTDFTVAYVVQAALGGHAIPVDSSTLQVLHIVGLIGDEDLAAGSVPGMERAISKGKGIEFASLLHQLAADFAVNPFSPAVRKVLLEINPHCADRLPRRRRKRRGEPKKEAAAAEQSPQEKQRRGAKKKAAATPAGKSRKAKSSGSRPSDKATKQGKTKKAKSSRAAAGGKKGERSKLAKRKPR